jgi:hypothetical protein
MARLGRFERPTSGSGDLEVILTRCENFGLYYIPQADTTTKISSVLNRFDLL